MFALERNLMSCKDKMELCSERRRFSTSSHNFGTSADSEYGVELLQAMECCGTLHNPDGLPTLLSLLSTFYINDLLFKKETGSHVTM